MFPLLGAVAWGAFAEGVTFLNLNIDLYQIYPEEVAWGAFAEGVTLGVSVYQAVRSRD